MSLGLDFGEGGSCIHVHRYVYLKVLCGDSLSSHSSSHLLPWPNSPRVLSPSCGPHLTVSLGDSMGRRLTFHTMPLHHTLEPLTNAIRIRTIITADMSKNRIFTGHMYIYLD